MSDKDFGSNRQGDLPGELVARLEVASEGSRELDIELMTMLGGARDTGGGVYYGPNEAVWHTSEVAENEGYWMLPAPSRSLDAALALAEQVLPEGWTVEIKTGARPFHRAIIHPRYSMENKQNLCPMGLSKASAATALCIAILKATTAAEVNQNTQVIP